MINTDRIVPITAIDLISMYGLILKQSVTDLTAVQAVNPGEFEIMAAATPLIASEPIATCDFAEDISTAALYFVPSYDYKGFTVGGLPGTETGAVNPDGRTLYKAELSGGGVTVTQAGF